MPDKLWSLRELVSHLKQRPRMFVLSGTYLEICSFLAGFECGRPESSILVEFNKWLGPRGKGKPNLWWPQLVLCEIYPEGSLPDPKSLTAEQDEQAVAALFALLEEFFESGGAINIGERSVVELALECVDRDDLIDYVANLTDANISDISVRSTEMLADLKPEDYREAIGLAAAELIDSWRNSSSAK